MINCQETMFVGDLNAKCGRETHFIPMIGSESIYESSNGNALRLISFATAKNMTISNTIFPHKNIHKVTWKSPDGTTANQIDDVIIQETIRNFRGADCDTDHFLVVAKFKLKLQNHKRLVKRNSTIINLEMLKNEEIQQKYSKNVDEYVKSIELNDIDEDWDKVSKVTKEISVKK